MLNRLESIAYSAGFLSFDVPAGMYKEFLLIYRGTNVAAGDTTLADLGSVVMRRNGIPKVAVPVSVLATLNNEYRGVASFSNVNGGAVFAMIPLPCGQFKKSENNVYAVEEQELTIELTFAELASATGWSAGTVEVYGVPQIGVEKYEYQLISHDFVLGAAGTIQPKTITIPNILQLILTNTNLASNINITKDGKLAFNTAVDVSQAYSDMIHELETTIANTSILEFAQSGDIREAVGSSIRVEATSTGAGTFNVYTGSLIFNNDKTVRSIAKANAEIQRNYVSAGAEAQKPVIVSNPVIPGNLDPAVLGGVRLR